ncbi:unnamed protein product [Rhizoctonia solani]|uniref:Asl1-like glycosyl hydrolase catalytic domain-containing protein n=1 Tax=Rhizoctonia solani TaxID=456999 RepID=A0A8H3CKF2_9AGAM|nr:unnamed protein product [Rhizoctonia solani]
MLLTWLSFAASCQATVIKQRQIPAPTPSSQLNKTGLAWGGGDADITQYESAKVSWYYTWGPNDWVQGENNLEYVPMFWGPKNADTFRTYVNESTIASNGIKHVLGMNEPEQTGQSNLSAADAVQWWQTYMEPLRQYNVSLGSPAMSAATRSKQWLIDFATACEPYGGCNYDFLALRECPSLMSAATRSKQWLIDFATACEPYGGCNYDFLALRECPSLQDEYRSLREAQIGTGSIQRSSLPIWKTCTRRFLISRYGSRNSHAITFKKAVHNVPIWLTEFACHNFQEGGPQCTYADTVSFMNTTQAWLDQQDWVHRYAWFGAMKEPVINTVNALMDPSGLINDLGKQYIGEMAAPANPTHPASSGGAAKVNRGYIAGAPIPTASLLVGALAGVALTFA